MPLRGNSATISILAAKGVDWIQAHHHLAARRTNQKPFATRHHQAMRLDDNFSAFSTLSHIAPESVVVHDKERGHGAGEQPVLVAEALLVQVPGDEEGEPAVVSELVRVPVPRSSRRGEVA